MNAGAILASSHARNRTCSSLSKTQGPAIRASGAPSPISSCDVIRTGVGDFALHPAALVLERGADEGTEQRMRLQRLGLELGMELAAQIPGVIRDLSDLDVNGVRRFTREPKSVPLQDVFVFAVEFVTVAMALADFGFSVSGAREAAGCEQARISAQAHGAAQLVDAFQLAQLVDDA